jgi:hypothetical protein
MSKAFVSTNRQVQEQDIDRTMQELSAFLEVQNEWLQRVEEAYAKGYHVEATTLAKNQIHAVLRKSLWLHSVLSAAHLPTVEMDAYIAQLLAKPEETLPCGVGQRELYGAAQRFDLLDIATTKTLNVLYERNAILLREAFANDGRSIEDIMEALGKIAAQFVRIDQECIERLKINIDTFVKTIRPLVSQ